MSKDAAVEGMDPNLPEAPSGAQPRSMTLKGSGLDDEGHRGRHTHDEIRMLNAHPHIDHSASFEHNAALYSTGSHGFQGHHVIHNPRGKGAEHHPPSGLMDCKADNTPETQEIF